MKSPKWQEQPFVTQNLEQDPWSEPFAETIDGRIEAIGGLPHGAPDGKPVVVVKAILSDGRMALVQTRLDQFMRAADALWLAYGKPSVD